MSEWISVSTEMPDNPKYKLVDDIVFVDSSGCVHLGIYASGKWKEWGPNMFETMEWVTVDSCILYWMPLPSIPKD